MTEQLAIDWAYFIDLEQKVMGSEATGLEARWLFGQGLLPYEAKRGRGGSELADAIRALVAEFPHLSEPEAYNRRQFAETCKTREQFSHALENYPTWHDMVASRFGTKVAPPKVPTTPPLPGGRFLTIVIDPPWPVQKIEREERPNQAAWLDYPVMSIEEIRALPIGDLADPEGAHIYLWTTHKFLPDALEIFEAWGARYQCLMTWVKNVGMTPFSWMYSTEHVLFGRIGSLELLRNGLRLDFAAEARKIRDGFARWYFYGWAQDTSNLADWMIVDLDVVRDTGLIDWAIDHDRERTNPDGTTTFLWLKPLELATVSALVAHSFDWAEAA